MGEAGRGQEEYDAERTAFLESKGCSLLRFWNGDVMNNINGVMAVILEELEELSPAEMRAGKDCDCGKSNETGG